MSSPTLEQFEASVKDLTLEDLVTVVKTELGADLQSTTRGAAVPEAFEFFSAHDSGSTPEPPAPEQPAAARAASTPGPDVSSGPPAAEPVTAATEAAAKQAQLNVKAIADAQEQTAKKAKADAKKAKAADAKASREQQKRAASPPEELQYEARSRTGRAFYKGGRVFGVKWEPVGALTKAELVVLEKFSKFIQYRIRG